MPEADLPEFLRPLKQATLQLEREADHRLAWEAGGGTSSVVMVPNATMSVQEQDFWCWSAVTQSVRTIRGDSFRTQAEIAHDHLSTQGTAISCGGNSHQTDTAVGCSDQGCTGECNSQHVLRIVLGENHRYGGRETSPPSAQVIKGQTANQLPLACLIRYGSGGHFILIVGWKKQSEGEFVTVLDPADGAKGSPAKLRDVPMGRITRGLYDSFTAAGSGTIDFVYRVT